MQLTAKTNAILNYLKGIPDYKEYALNTLPNIINSKEKEYNDELKLLKIQCAKEFVTPKYFEKISQLSLKRM